MIYLLIIFILIQNFCHAEINRDDIINFETAQISKVFEDLRTSSWKTIDSKRLNKIFSFPLKESECANVNSKAICKMLSYKKADTSDCCKSGIVLILHTDPSAGKEELSSIHFYYLFQSEQDAKDYAKEMTESLKPLVPIWWTTIK